jgi:small subunit ribosomal protein S8
MTSVGTDPVADLLTRLRNAIQAGHGEVLAPFSSVKQAVLKVLKEEGFVRNVEVVGSGPRRALKVTLAYTAARQPVLHGLQRVSKPGLRRYVGKREIPRVHGGVGMAIVSTPQGMMTGQEARERGVGGEVMCYVW